MGPVPVRTFGRGTCGDGFSERYMLSSRGRRSVEGSDKDQGLLSEKVESLRGDEDGGSRVSPPLDTYRELPTSDTTGQDPSPDHFFTTFSLRGLKS